MDKFKAFADACNRLQKSVERVKIALELFEAESPKIWLSKEEAFQVQLVLRRVGSLGDTEHCKNCTELAESIFKRIELADSFKVCYDYDNALNNALSEIKEKALKIRKINEVE